MRKDKLLQLLIIFPIFVATSLFYSCAKKKEFVLADHGKSSYKIVLTNDASPSEKHAAKELQQFIHMATNANLLIIDESDNAAQNGQRIFVGAGDLAKSVFPAKNVFEPDEWKELRDEGFIIRTISHREMHFFDVAGQVLFQCKGNGARQALFVHGWQIHMGQQNIHAGHHYHHLATSGMIGSGFQIAIIYQPRQLTSFPNNPAYGQ